MAKVDWYGDKLKLQLTAASEAMVAAAAQQIEAEAKVNVTNNGQVDTGFMRQSIYSVTPRGGGNPPGGGSYHSAKENRQVERKALPARTAPDGGAVVAVGAEYGIYQEMARPFLYPAVERVGGNMGQIVQAGAGEIE